MNLQLDTMLVHFIAKRPRISIYSFNCQGLRSHVQDIIDSVSYKSDILLLSETDMDKDLVIDIPNFNCIVKYKRTSFRLKGFEFKFK